MTKSVRSFCVTGYADLPASNNLAQRRANWISSRYIVITLTASPKWPPTRKKAVASAYRFFYRRAYAFLEAADFHRSSLKSLIRNSKVFLYSGLTVICC
jgi:hypothetical protein